MISCGEPVDNEVVVMGEVMYVIDAFIEKRAIDDNASHYSHLYLDLCGALQRAAVVHVFSSI